MQTEPKLDYRPNPRTYGQALSCLVASIHAVSDAANPLNVRKPGELLQPTSEMLELCIEDAFAKDLSAVNAGLAKGIRDDLFFKLMRDSFVMLNPANPDFSYRLESLSQRMGQCGFKLLIQKPDGSQLEWFPEVDVLPHQKLVLQKSLRG